MNQKLTFLVSLAALIMPISASAGPEGIDNQADINHPNIHDKVGDGTNANPRGKTTDGGGIHGIGNVPGQSDAHPSDGAPGFADQLNTVHGGIGDVNKNAE